MWFFTRKETDRLSEKERLRRLTLQRLRRLDFDKSDVAKKFDDIVKEFFKDHFKLRYAFTFNELDRHIKRKRLSKETKDSIREFVKDYNEKKYNGRKLGEMDLRKLKKQFHDILLDLRN